MRCDIVLLVCFSLLFAGCFGTESSNKATVKTETEIETEGTTQEGSQQEVKQDASSTQKIIINDHLLTQTEIAELIKIYGTVQPGEFWYDQTSGLYGDIGGPTKGRIYAGHNFGTLKRDASNGNTGVLINGRELTEEEIQYLERLLGVTRQKGEYWLDSYGNLGSSQYGVIANIYSQKGGSSGGGNDGWSTSSGFYGGSSGGCSYVSIPGATGSIESTVTTSGCG